MLDWKHEAEGQGGKGQVAEGQGAEDVMLDWKHDHIFK
jgi:hypothetical protein